MITRNNYELFIIDFYDGQLNPIQKEELRRFLEANPDLKQEFEFFADATLQAEKIVFSGKENLKKKDNGTTETLIAYFENDLNLAERKDVDRQLRSSDAMTAELEIIKKTRQVPDYTIVFEDKSSLKRNARVISFSRTFYRNLSIAASIILIAIAYFIFRPDRASEKMMANDKNDVQMPAPLPVQKSIQEKPALANEAPVKENSIKRSRENSTENSQENSTKKLRKEKSVVSPEENFTAQKNQNISKQPSDSKLPQNHLPDNNMANQIRIETPAPIVNQPLTSNSGKIVEVKQAELKVTDLSEIFTPQEIAELGFKPNAPEKGKESSTILDYASDKLKHFSDSKDIELNKKENILSNATTYAVNIGKNFSLSHTSAK